MFHKVVWCGGILNNQFTANLPRNVPVGKFGKSVKIWQNNGHEFVASLFGPPCANCASTESITTIVSLWLLWQNYVKSVNLSHVDDDVHRTIQQNLASCVNRGKDLVSVPAPNGTSKSNSNSSFQPFIRSNIWMQCYTNHFCGLVRICRKRRL